MTPYQICLCCGDAFKKESDKPFCPYCIEMFVKNINGIRDFILKDRGRKW